MQNPASARRCLATVIDISSDSIGPSAQQSDEKPTKTPWQELAHSQGVGENADVPDATDYQAPFVEEAEKISESSLLNDMKKQLDQLPSERMQGRDEMKKELDELREERRQEVQGMLDNRTHELRNEIHEIREEIKILIHAVEQIAHNTKRSGKEN